MNRQNSEFDVKNNQTWHDAVKQLMEEYGDFYDKKHSKAQEATERAISEANPFLFLDDDFESNVETATAEEAEYSPTRVDRAAEILSKEMILSMRHAIIQDRQITAEVDFLNLEKEGLRVEGDKSTNPNINGNRRAIERIVDRVEKLEQQRDELIMSNPDAHYAINALDFRQDILRAKQGKMIETPYVKNAKSHLMNNLLNGQPQFIHGELGGGKTEIALQTAREFLINRQVQDDMVEIKSKLRQELDSSQPNNRQEYIKRYV